jgi:AcrR family transcriptional regulator
MTESADPPRPLRADARKNRERILEAAAVVFARDGLEASLDSVAAEAEVGVGTVYRRFPERQDLINELFEDKIGKFVSLAEDCDRMDDPFEGLVRFLSEASRMHGEDLGLRQLVLGPGVDSELMDLPRRTLGPIVGRLVERAKANGDLREDFAVLDVPLIEFMLAQINDFTSHAAPELWERLLTLVIDGLRASRNGVTPMPAEPMEPAAYLRAISTANRRS